MTTVTVVCGDEPAIDPGNSHVEVVADLCRRPAKVIESARDAERIVLVLHAGAYDLAHVQKALRGSDIDPLGAQIFDADTETGLSEAVLAGLAARASAFTGSDPENAKPVRPPKVTRRGLLRPPAHSYEAVPRLDRAACAAADGCRACVESCPRDAYEWRQGRVRFDKQACLPCGRCVTVCPTEAIDNPAATAVMLAAQVATVVAQSVEPVGIRFVCSRARLGTIDGWVDIAVPCTSMVTGTRLLTAALLGAGAVTSATCGEGGCPIGLDAVTIESIDFARHALGAAGLDQAHVVAIAGDVPPALASVEISEPFTREGDLQTIAALEALSRMPMPFDHPGASTGIVSIDPGACTLCAQCAQTCPTGAITVAYERDVVSIWFDPAACTKCSQCQIACPEIERGAIRVDARVDPAALTGGSYELLRGAVLVCDSCGRPIAPTPMMERIGELLGDDFEKTMSYVSRRCVGCRGAS
jgi:ferredoxin